MPKLFFLRHAESEANIKSEYAGHLPVSITKQGEEEAKHTAQEFAKEHRIDRIISSTLLRAKQTASFFSEAFQLPIEEEERVVEQNMGIFSGEKYAWSENHPQYEADISKRWNWCPPGGGESYEDVSTRILPFIKELESITDQSILIVSHGVALRLIRSILENTLPLYYTGLSKNCEILHCDFVKLNQKHATKTLYYCNPNKITHKE